MPEEILPQLYLARIPLPNSSLLYLNSYIIKDSNRSLIIDTGMNREECRLEMTKNLHELDIDLNQADFFITHLHADHVGLVGSLATQASQVYFSRLEAPEFYNPNLWKERLDSFAVIYGFPQVELRKLLDNRSEHGDNFTNIPNVKILSEGDRINVGEYSFQCIETPGHSTGHMCLYAAKQKLLISGDHILRDITPNISTRYNSGNALKDYLQSLDKIYSLDVSLVLPGHGDTMKDLQKRIREIKQHHETRTREQLAILGKGPQDAYQVTSQMNWDIAYDDWNSLPPFQKYFAFAECLSHLQYLESLGKVQAKILSDDKIVYSLSN